MDKYILRISRGIPPQSILGRRVKPSISCVHMCRIKNVSSRIEKRHFQSQFRNPVCFSARTARCVMNNSYKRTFYSGRRFPRKECYEGNEKTAYFSHGVTMGNRPKSRTIIIRSTSSYRNGLVFDFIPKQFSL